MSVFERDEVYSAREVAQAAGVPAGQVEALLASGELPSVGGRFVRHADAVSLGRRLRRREESTEPTQGPTIDPLRTAIAAAAVSEPPGLFEARVGAPRDATLPALLSGAAHVAVGLGVILLTAAGVGSASADRAEYRVSEPMRLVYLATPGPGGGGGGGGLRQPAPPPAAKREGKRSLSSPLPEREPPPPLEPPELEAPPPPPAEPLPPVVAPVATVAGDTEDKAGVLEKSASEADSRGSGDGGGVGSGRGTGIGEGDGSGIGPGSGGGMGGGPYRPGSGIQPPSLLREVKPSYTEDARRLGITGDVLLEIVVRADGRVGDVRVLDGLGHGLDERAVDAVRQWRFAPAKRFGQPVDVLVEVAVEFRLR